MHWLLVLEWHIASSTALLHYVLTVLEWLGKAADWTDDVLVGVHGEWKDWDKAEREPVPALLDLGGPVTLLSVSGCFAL